MALIEKIRSHLVTDHPEIVLYPPQGLTLGEYIADWVEKLKPALQQFVKDGHSVYKAEEICIEALKNGLGPSKTGYIRTILKEEFTDDYERMAEDGILTAALIGMLAQCRTAFESFEFSKETITDSHLRHAVIFEVYNYLFESKKP